MGCTFSKKKKLTCNPYDGDNARLDNNKKRIHTVFKTQGEAAGLKALLTGPSGEKLTYDESREMYG